MNPLPISNASSLKTLFLAFRKVVFYSYEFHIEYFPQKTFGGVWYFHLKFYRLSHVVSPCVPTEANIARININSRILNMRLGLKTQINYYYGTEAFLLNTVL